MICVCDLVCHAEQPKVCDDNNNSKLIAKTLPHHSCPNS